MAETAACAQRERASGVASPCVDGEGAAAHTARASSWVSEGLEVLELELSQPDIDDTNPHFDVLIVGSGYGGSVAADRLASHRWPDATTPPRVASVAVLERGREYLPGAFPGSFADLPGHVRFTLPGSRKARGRLDGLFDVRVGVDMSVVVANGVGGGSLINAGVMLLPDKSVFDDPAWPLSTTGWYEEVRQRARTLQAELGAGGSGSPNAAPADAGYARVVAMDRLARAADDSGAVRVPVSVAFNDESRTCAGTELQRCLGCGDCATGCNHGAKVSLDVGLLRRAQSRGARVFAGATVSRLRRVADAGLWEVDVWHTDLALRRRMARPIRVRARYLVLAAGALGSTELLLRSQDEALRFSPQLGRRFSGNGDVLAAIYDAGVEMNAVGDETVRPSARGVGPTITSMVDRRRDVGAAFHAGFVVQDLAVPAPLQRLMEEVTTTTALMQGLGEPYGGSHAPDQRGIDPFAVDTRAQRRSCVVALITRDDAAGCLHAVPAPTDRDGLDAELEVDPGVRIEWPAAPEDPRVQACHDGLQALLDTHGSIGGRVLPNPAWRIAPEAMSRTLGLPRGPLLTVHPLGGCAMGDCGEYGVVDAWGRVFDGARGESAVHPGLYVMDGAIVPCSLGINPALTIAALADRAVEKLLAELRAQPCTPASPPAPSRRPVFKRDNDVARSARATEAQVVERMIGEVTIGGRPRVVELSLAFEPTPLPGRDTTLEGWTLNVRPDAALSRLRIFDVPAAPSGGRIRRLQDRDDDPGTVRQFWRASDAEALIVVPVAGGSLRALHRGASTASLRRLRALRAWVGNRALRDLRVGLGQRLAGRGAGLNLGGLCGLLSRAGEVRRLDYALWLGTASGGGDAALRQVWDALDPSCRRLAAFKRLTYARRGNPWRQLTEAELTALGNWPIQGAPRLSVDPAYFAQLQVPLMRVTAQQNLPLAFADLARFGMYMLRMLVSIHLWSFRKPDPPPRRAPQRLPGPLPGLPAPSVHELWVQGPQQPFAGLLRLSRYGRAASDARPPVLMIHGYSASGTTFAHPALRPSLAQALWQAGRDAWVLDLRSSAGMPEAGRKPWTFEDLAEGDVPAAVDFVCAAAGTAKVDVVTHCMGSAVFSMALLGPPAVADRIRPRLRRWVMTQVAPAMLFSPANLLRAYLLRYALTLLPDLEYPIARAGGPAGADADLFDRLLATVPELGEGRGSEFDVENPGWRQLWRLTPWVGLRHRLDALFGRVFDARRMGPQVLERLDDFFGEIHLATASQTLHFANWSSVTDAQGRPAPYAPFGANPLAGVDWYSLHALDSGLSSWETALAMRERFRPEGKRIWLVERSGHQDLWLGEQAPEVVGKVLELLQR